MIFLGKGDTLYNFSLFRLDVEKLQWVRSRERDSFSQFLHKIFYFHIFHNSFPFCRCKVPPSILKQSLDKSMQENFSPACNYQYYTLYMYNVHLVHPRPLCGFYIVQKSHQRLLDIKTPINLHKSCSFWPWENWKAVGDHVRVKPWCRPWMFLVNKHIVQTEDWELRNGGIKSDCGINRSP